MQSVFYEPQLRPAVDVRQRTHESSLSDWRHRLPTLRAAGVTLRELEPSDAPLLLAFLATSEVTEFMSVPPASVEGFERFIEWTHGERASGRGICLGIVPDGFDCAVGIIQVRALEPDFTRAEWGFALGSAFWGTGLFVASARLALEFVFETVGVHRLEARSVVMNGRGNGVLCKLGAVQEGILRQSFLRHGKYFDQTLWSILGCDWRQSRVATRPRVH